MANIEINANLLVEESNGSNRPLRVSDFMATATQEGILDALSTLVAQGAGAFYMHVQSAASALWTIDHPLPRRPAVVVVDSGGRQVYGEVSYPAANRVRIQFSAPFGGTAYLS